MRIPTWFVSASAALPALAALATRPAGAAETGDARGSALGLADAEALALRHQPAVLGARGQSEAAEGRVEQARAGVLPQVSVNATYQRTTGNFAPRPGALPTATGTTTWNTTTYDYFSFGASASQLIYDFGQASGRWRSAAATRDAARDNERAIRAQTLLAVRRAYFQARAQKDLIAVAEETVHNQDKHLTQIQSFVRAGIRPDIDLAQARTDLANGTVLLVGARANYALALAALEQATGTPVPVGVELKDAELPAVTGEDGPSDALVAQALQARPEIAVLRQRQQAQDLTIGALEGGYGPTLAATAGATDTATALDRLVPNFFIGLTAAWPLLQGGLTRGQVREARGTLASIAADVETLRLQIRTDVMQAGLGITTSKSTIAATVEALTNARERLRLAERRYETGIGSAIELGDAQVASTSAGAQAIGARTGLSIARAQLLAALGSP